MLLILMINPRDSGITFFLSIFQIFPSPFFPSPGAFLHVCKMSGLFYRRSKFLFGVLPKKLLPATQNLHQNCCWLWWTSSDPGCLIRKIPEYELDVVQIMSWVSSYLVRFFTLFICIETYTLHHSDFQNRFETCSSESYWYFMILN